MKNFKKKPVVIQAVQITQDTFDATHPNPEHVRGVIYNPIDRTVEIKTLEGMMRAGIGDWIIKGVKGEIYPCKDDIFRMTYDEVTP